MRCVLYVRECFRVCSVGKELQIRGKSVSVCAHSRSLTLIPDHVTQVSWSAGGNPPWGGVPSGPPPPHPGLSAVLENLVSW